MKKQILVLISLVIAVITNAQTLNDNNSLPSTQSTPRNLPILVDDAYPDKDVVVNHTDIDLNRPMGLYAISYGAPGSDALLDVSGISGSTPRFQLRANYHDKLYFRAARDGAENWDNKGFKEILMINEDGNVAINTTNSRGYRLAVNGSIISDEVRVLPYSQWPWPDYVFEKGYDLPSLEEVEKFITKNKHLENIPNAETVEKEGIDLGVMNAKLLEKIEELTLYLIDQNKIIKENKQEIQDLKKKLNQLSK